MNVGNASILEIVWAVSGLIGLSVNVWALNDAIADLRWQEAAPVPEAPDRRFGIHDQLIRERLVRERIARAGARDESIRCLIQLIFLLVGVVALSVPPVDRQGGTDAPLSFVVVAGFMAAQGLLVTKSILARRDRHWVIGTMTRRIWRDGAR